MTTQAVGMVMTEKEHFYGQHVLYAAQKHNLFDDPSNNKNSLTHKTPLFIILRCAMIVAGDPRLTEKPYFSNPFMRLKWKRVY
jgi:hypothetical protein